MATLYEFQQQFPDDEACLHHIMVTRYGGTELTCPKCKKHGKFYRMTKERGYICQHCGHHLHPTADTFMHRSHLPLHKWFLAMHLFTTSRHGVAAMELKRQLGVSYPTAWRMAHKIREHMDKTDGEWPLGGGGGKDIEADETYIGGKASGGKRGRGAPNKTVAFGMLERGGDIMTEVVPNVRKHTLQPIITGNVIAGSTIHTDELRSYKGLDKAGYRPSTVNHGAGQYADGTSHVNSIEGFWARLKLSIRGTHVHVSKQHFRKYLKEFEYRYNRRNEPDAMFGDLIAGFS